MEVAGSLQGYFLEVEMNVPALGGHILESTTFRWLKMS